MTSSWKAIDGDNKMPPDKTLLFCVIIGDISEPYYLPGKAKLVKGLLEPDYFYKISGKEDAKITSKFWMEIPDVPSWEYPPNEESSF